MAVAGEKFDETETYRENVSVSVYPLAYSKRRRRKVQRVFFLNCFPVAGNIAQKMEPRERNEKEGSSNI